jgi:hypothetical protein
VSGSFNERGELDLGDGRLILCVGKKRSGKSVMARLLFATYPGDRIVLDVAGDDGPSGRDVIDLQGDCSTLPERWPEHRRDGDKPMTLRYVPDHGSPTVMEDMDAIIGLAMKHGREQRDQGKPGCCLLVHEVGVVAPPHKSPPHMRRLLNANRHYAVTGIMCGPRPMNIDPLVLQQADLVYGFEMPNRNDRVRLGEQMGWDAGELDAAFRELGPHEYLRFDANEEKPQEGDEDVRLLHFEKLPDDVVKAIP